MRKPLRRSKIVCTIGPAVQSIEMIRELILAGMDVARLNFSHGSHEIHKESIQRLRQASKELGIEIAVLGDLQGPKIRVGKIEGANLLLKANDALFFYGVESTHGLPIARGTQDSPIAISYPNLVKDLRPGDILLFDDGMVRMKVARVYADTSLLEATVEFGAKLGENKGVNMPNAKLSGLGITEKDWEDIQFGIQEGVDFFALSFVRSHREVKNLKELLHKKKSGIHVIAKIEKPEAVENIDAILEAADGIMVARGDLGVEIGNEQVAVAQKFLIQKARLSGKPVITATQMLMSMVENPTPSRAEASDVANAVLDGTDAVMLSNETATGKYPIESVATMAKIIDGAEDWIRSSLASTETPLSQEPDKLLTLTEAIEISAARLADRLGARAIATLTRSGLSARLLAKYRPRVPILAFAENSRVRSQLALTWGVYVIPWEEMPSMDHTVFDDLLRELKRLGLIETTDKIVATAGIPTSLKQGTTNTIVVKSLADS